MGAQTIVSNNGIPRYTWKTGKHHQFLGNPVPVWWIEQMIQEINAGSTRRGRPTLPLLQHLRDNGNSPITGRLIVGHLHLRWNEVDLLRFVLRNELRMPASVETVTRSGLWFDETYRIGEVAPPAE